MRWLIGVALVLGLAAALAAQDGGCETERSVFYPTGSSKIWVWAAPIAEDRKADLGGEWTWMLVSQRNQRQSWRGLCVGS